MSTKKYRISVLIPVFNAQKFLEESLNSVVSQTYRDFECIIVDDGSTDSTAEICDRYAKEYENFRVIHQENKGVSAARNLLVSEAESEWILFHDADDIIHPRTLELLNSALEADAEADISAGTYKPVKSTGEINYELKGSSFKEIPFDDVYKMPVWSAPCCKLFRKTLFEGLKYPEGMVHEDEAVTWKLFYRAKKILRTEEELYFYRQHEDSIIHTPDEKKFIYKWSIISQNIREAEKLGALKFKEAQMFRLRFALDHLLEKQSDDNWFMYVLGKNLSRRTYKHCVRDYISLEKEPLKARIRKYLYYTSKTFRFLRQFHLKIKGTF